MFLAQILGLKLSRIQIFKNDLLQAYILDLKLKRNGVSANIHELSHQPELPRMFHSLPLTQWQTLPAVRGPICSLDLKLKGNGISINFRRLDHQDRAYMFSLLYTQCQTFSILHLHLIHRMHCNLNTSVCT